MPQSVSSRSALVALKSSHLTSIVAGTDAGLLFNMNYRGALYGGMPMRISGSLMPSIDVASGGNGAEFAYVDGSNIKWRELAFGPLNVRASWLSAWRDMFRSSYIACGSDLAPVASRDWRSIDKNLIVYPNPSNGERVAFHFPSPSSGRADLTIMTLSGERVMSREKSLSGGDSEFVIDMKGKSSGIYICRLVVHDGSGNRAEALKKFAIVK